MMFTMKRTTKMNVCAGLLCLSLAVSSVLAQTPDRSKPPELGAPPSMQLPPIQHLKLANGLPVVLMEKHTLPLVNIQLVVYAGSAMDPAGQGGLASLMSSMMEEGAGKRNALELADAIDYLGASISSSAGQHTMGVSLHTPLSKLDSALALFADVALRPTFPKEELERRARVVALFPNKTSTLGLVSARLSEITTELATVKTRLDMNAD